MTSPLTIVYLTARRQPQLHWFFSSLARECNAHPQIPRPEIICVDHHCQEFNESAGPIWTPPKPNVWNGPHRLTREDWFNAASARNTGLALCRTEWVAFVDDLSLLCPGWLPAAMEATTHPRHVTCGSYRKLKQLVVGPAGNAVSWEDFPAGVDNRQRHIDQELKGGVVVPCSGNWLYGCSLVAAVEAFLEINGWCEDWCGGTGFEDCVTGIVLENAGWEFRYDTRLMSWESEELHHVERPMRKTDKGVSPNDKSHAILDRTRHLKRFENYFDLRAMRASVLAGQPFPIPTEPVVDWFDQQALKDMI